MIVNYEPQHLTSLGPAKDYAEALDNHAFTYFEDGRVSACGGFIDMGPRTMVWLYTGTMRNPTAFFRAARKVIREAGFRRIETVATTDFGHRLARLLGFTWEGVLHAYNEDGSDADLYAIWQQHQ